MLLNSHSFIQILLMLVLSSGFFIFPSASEENLHAESGDYQSVNVEEQYQNDRSFEALNATFTSICDGILTSSSKNSKLSAKQDKLVTNFIKQNALFKQPGFDKAWLDQLKVNLDKLQKEERNKIAPALKKKIEQLYLENRNI